MDKTLKKPLILFLSLVGRPANNIPTLFWKGGNDMPEIKNFEFIEDQDGFVSLLGKMKEAEDFDTVLDLVKKAQEMIESKKEFKEDKEDKGEEKEKISEFAEKDLQAKLAGILKLKTPGLMKEKLGKLLSDHPQFQKEGLSSELNKILKNTDSDKTKEAIGKLADSYPQFAKVAKDGVAGKLKKLLKIEDVEELRKGIQALIPADNSFKKSGGESANLFDQEIMAVGKANGKDITKKDLLELAENSVKLKEVIKPPLKLGHNDEQDLSKGLPSLGTVSNLRVENDKLVADFTDVPAAIAEIIRKKAYYRVSPEVYFNFEDNQGKKWGKVLRAVALLGEEVPAIKTLKDVEALYHKSSFSDDFGEWGLLVEQENKKGGNMATERIDKIEKDTATLVKENISLKVDKFIEGHSEKVLPTFEPIVRGLLTETFKEEQEVIKFKEKDVEKSFNIAGAVMELIERLPNLVEFSEKGKSSGNEEEDKELKDFNKVKEYAEKNKMSFEQAHTALLEKKEIK